MHYAWTVQAGVDCDHVMFAAAKFEITRVTLIKINVKQ